MLPVKISYNMQGCYFATSRYLSDCMESIVPLDEITGCIGRL